MWSSWWDTEFFQERKEQLAELEANMQATLNDHVELESNTTSTICPEEVEEPSLESRPDENVVGLELGNSFGWE